jgi:hypothetical protein
VISHIEIRYTVDIPEDLRQTVDALRQELIATRQALEIAFKYVPDHKIQEVKAPLIPFDFPDKEVT